MLKNVVQEKMYEAMKKGNKKDKAIYSYMLDRLKKKEIDVRHELSTDEEMEVVLRMVKEAKETVVAMPDGDARKIDAEYELSLYQDFLPKQMTEDEVREVIKETVVELGIEKLTNQSKGILMKNLMPKVKGKADGKVVASLVAELM